jgi:hypothetical protein
MMAEQAPEPWPMGTYTTSSCGTALNSSHQYVATPRSKLTWKLGTMWAPRCAANANACSRLSWKSVPCSINVTPRARMAAFFSSELPCGTTMVQGTPWARAAQPMLWPWLPRVALMTSLGKLPDFFSWSK